MRLKASAYPLAPLFTALLQVFAALLLFPGQLCRQVQKISEPRLSKGSPMGGLRASQRLFFQLSSQIAAEVEVDLHIEVRCL